MVWVKTRQSGRGQAYCRLGLGQVQGGTGRADKVWMLSKGMYGRTSIHAEGLRTRQDRALLGQGQSCAGYDGIMHWLGSSRPSSKGI